MIHELLGEVARLRNVILLLEGLLGQIKSSFELGQDVLKTALLEEPLHPVEAKSALVGEILISRRLNDGIDDV